MEDTMSAAVAWDLSTAPVRVPARPARPRLVLVPTGDVLPAEPARHVRLTRAGRLAITLTMAIAAAVLALSMFGGGSAAPAIDHATTVEQGQTLSQIAAEQLPQLPVAEAVAQLQLANNLPSAHVHAGQSLVIPAIG
jgi:LysM domain